MWSWKIERALGSGFANYCTSRLRRPQMASGHGLDGEGTFVQAACRSRYLHEAGGSFECAPAARESSHSDAPEATLRRIGPGLHPGSWFSRNNLGNIGIVPWPNETESFLAVAPAFSRSRSFGDACDRKLTR